jgi:hypothetical protein
LYAHALRQRDWLQLSVSEILLTRAALAENLIYVGVCLLSIVLAYTTPYPSLPGYIYLLLGPLQAFSGRRYGKRARAAAAVPA